MRSAAQRAAAAAVHASGGFQQCSAVAADEGGLREQQFLVCLDIDRGLLRSMQQLLSCMHLAGFSRSAANNVKVMHKGF
jgi:hypothetical protein